MELVNLTNGTVLAQRIEVSNCFKKRLRGLIGRPVLKPGEAMILMPCKSVHTFFMSFPIDVIFLDKEAVVIKILEKMKPFRFSPVIPRAEISVELPAGCLAHTCTREGHCLQINI
ncbi:MAG TPA: DUF192 domain-containing protein [Bacillota bacterium]|nr:DUF192 domain-containing protein [Bacillota bacterium]